jgi:hypothetical protein
MRNNLRDEPIPNKEPQLPARGKKYAPIHFRAHGGRLLLRRLKHPLTGKSLV